MTDVVRARCAEVIHLRFEDGTMITGGRAILQMLSVLGAGPLARLCSWPPFVWGVEALYWLVAHNRVFFDRLLFRRR